ncbi:hypothetical protein CEUSTIGMA_g6059.t1 [Chlamydomonas eustigma]|uniref:Uncharacterized protein n=1 Tax=Chlamydomonas eustigma TaxID=1157962 RepID=A0A250X786_9CHLO|nr:hypothetical protein CEUSTIGMA_g6059.t1 [Chlamydomonas eustigma]|eukprot:GAX78620.1 hypothetical protein CEUSTIGMA_g6059.t1 [Chlamydomonas eustigma]
MSSLDSVIACATLKVDDDEALRSERCVYARTLVLAGAFEAACVQNILAGNIQGAAEAISEIGSVSALLAACMIILDHLATQTAALKPTSSLLDDNNCDLNGLHHQVVTSLLPLAVTYALRAALRLVSCQHHMPNNPPVSAEDKGIESCTIAATSLSHDIHHRVLTILTCCKSLCAAHVSMQVEAALCAIAAATITLSSRLHSKLISLIRHSSYDPTPRHNINITNEQSSPGPSSWLHVQIQRLMLSGCAVKATSGVNNDILEDPSHTTTSCLRGLDTEHQLSALIVPLLDLEFFLGEAMSAVPQPWLLSNNSPQPPSLQEHAGGGEGEALLMAVKMDSLLKLFEKTAAALEVEDHLVETPASDQGTREVLSASAQQQQGIQAGLLSWTTNSAVMIKAAAILMQAGLRVVNMARKKVVTTEEHVEDVEATSLLRRALSLLGRACEDMKKTAQQMPSNQTVSIDSSRAAPSSSNTTKDVQISPHGHYLPYLPHGASSESPNYSPPSCGKAVAATTERQQVPFTTLESSLPLFCKQHEAEGGDDEETFVSSSATSATSAAASVPIDEETKQGPLSRSLSAIPAKCSFKYSAVELRALRLPALADAHSLEIVMRALELHANIKA